MPTTYEGTTLEAFAKSLNSTWESFPEDWLAWPPDAFALTLRRVCPNRLLPPRHRRAYEPRRGVAEGDGGGREPVAQLRQRAAGGSEARRGLELQRARAASPAGPPARPPIKVGDAGAPPGPRRRRPGGAGSSARRSSSSTAWPTRRAAGSASLCRSIRTRPSRTASPNLLLNAKGSLSSLPKHAGVVLPKMRTPQRGLTLRSLSLHLTYHATEVEVMWRAVPWPNLVENTLNVLAVPWPRAFHHGAFKQQRDTLQPVRYFRYQPDGRTPDLPTGRLVALVGRLERDYGCRLHVIALPESALSDGEYRQLLEALREARLADRIGSIPLVVAGVHRSGGVGLTEPVKRSTRSGCRRTSRGGGTRSRSGSTTAGSWIGTRSGSTASTAASQRGGTGTRRSRWVRGA